MVHGGLRYLQQTRVPPGLREPARASATSRERAVPRAPAPLPRPALRSQRRRLQGPREGLLDGPAPLRPERRVAHRPAPPQDHARTRRSRTCRRSTPIVWSPASSTIDARGDDARVALTLAQDGGARLRRRRRQLRARDRHHATTQTGRVARGRRVATNFGAIDVHDRDRRRRQRDRRVGRRRLRDGRTRHRRIGSRPPRASTSACRAIVCPPTWPPCFNVPGDRRSIFVVPFEDAPLHLRRHDRHRLRRSPRRTALHARGRGVPARRGQRVDVVGSHARRRHRSLGRTATAARARRGQDA